MKCVIILLTIICAEVTAFMLPVTLAWIIPQTLRITVFACVSKLFVCLCVQHVSTPMELMHNESIHCSALPSTKVTVFFVSFSAGTLGFCFTVRQDPRSSCVSPITHTWGGGEKKGVGKTGN